MGTQDTSSQEWNLASQMKNMVVTEAKKPTMSEIVKSGDSELNNSTMVDPAVEESRDSPKPIGPVKAVTSECSEEPKMPEIDVWSPWSDKWARRQSDVSLDDGFLELPPKTAEKTLEKSEPLKFEPLIGLTSGIWSNTHTTSDGW